MSKKHLYLSVFFILSFLLFSYKTSFKKALTFDNSVIIGKSHFPIWDLMEYQLKTNSRSVQLKNYPTYKESLNAFIAGETTVSMGTIYEAILAKSKGINVKIILLLDYTIGADAILSNKKLNYLSELKGKSIGVEYGSVAHYTALKAIDKSGLSPDDCQFIFKPMPELIPLFNTKEIDIISTYEPHLSTILTRNKETQLLFSSREIPRKICDVIFINKDLVSIDSQKKLFKQWMKIAKKIKNNPHRISEEMKSWHKENNKNHPFNTKGIYITGYADNHIAFSKDSFLEQSLKEMMSFMLEQKIIEKPVPISDMIEYQTGNHTL